MPAKEPGESPSLLRFSVLTMFAAVTGAALISATARWSEVGAILLAVCSIGLSTSDYLLQLIAQRRRRKQLIRQNRAPRGLLFRLLRGALLFVVGIGIGTLLAVLLTR